jgi:hypothetical protein
MQRAASIRSSGPSPHHPSPLAVEPALGAAARLRLAAGGEEQLLAFPVDVMALDNNLRGCRMIVRLYV